jgi:hypothetical protein
MSAAGTVPKNFDATGLASRTAETPPARKPYPWAKDAGPRCCYCGATDVPLEPDGPGKQSCIDAGECELRLTENVTGIRPARPLSTRGLGRPPSGAMGVVIPMLPTSYDLEGPIELSPDVTLPIEAAVARYVVLGKSGAGKTNADYVLAEEFMRSGVPVIILDVLGNMHGLRASTDGTKPGYPIPIIGGKYGDIALEPWMAETLARIAGSGITSMIIDLSGFSREDQQDFAADFFTEVIRHIETPVHFIVEEADTFAPKRLTSKAQHRSHTAITVFARYVRNHTGGWTFSTQRPPLLAHDIVDTASMFIAMRMTGEDSQEAIGAEVQSRAGKTLKKLMIESIGQLKTGDAYLVPDSGWLGEDVEKDYPIKMHFRLRDTFDASRRLKIGERRVPPAVRADVDLSPFGSLLEPHSTGAVDSADAPESEEEALAVNAGPAQSPTWDQAVREGQQKILTSLLVRMPIARTTKPLLLAITALHAEVFAAALEALLTLGYVDVRRGPGGGVAITPAALKKLGVKAAA